MRKVNVLYSMVFMITLFGVSVNHLNACTRVVYPVSYTHLYILSTISAIAPSPVTLQAVPKLSIAMSVSYTHLFLTLMQKQLTKNMLREK